MSDAFSRMRFDWLDAIGAHPDIDPAAFKVAYVISGLINRKTGDAWPSLDHLAAVIGVNERTVRRQIEALVKAGFLIKRRGNVRCPNRYRPAFPDRTPMSDQNDPPDRTPVSDQGHTGRPDTHVQSGEFQSGHPCHPDRTFDDTLTGHGCPPISLNNSLIEILEEDISPPTPSFAKSPKARGGKAALEIEFEEFWKQFPRRVAKGQALKAFKAARAKAELATIMAGAHRYGEARTGQDPRFTKHPATWLNGQCWTDEEPPQTPDRAHAPSSGFQTGQDRTREALQRLRAKDGAHG